MSSKFQRVKKILVAPVVKTTQHPSQLSCYEGLFAKYPEEVYGHVKFGKGKYF